MEVKKTMAKKYPSETEYNMFINKLKSIKSPFDQDKEIKKFMKKIK